jgi:uncharacterized membrane protein
MTTFAYRKVLPLSLLHHHPHPLILHFPIALTGAALFFIILALIWRIEILEEIAFTNISLAAVSTIVAAIFGIRDNLSYYIGTASYYTTKIIFAIILFILITTLALVRWRNPNLFTNRSTKAVNVIVYFQIF